MKIAISSSVLLLTLAGATNAQFGSNAGAPTKGIPKPSAGAPPSLSGGTAFLGGNDDCSTPMAIAGQGMFPFDTTGASTGTQGQLECGAIHNDVWWSWTADATGTATVTTCGQATHDTKLAAYPGGGCPPNGTSLGCNDDACGLQSSISFPVTSGTAYMIQLGSFGSTQSGTGNIVVSIAGPVTNDDCSNPIALAGQGTFAYSNLGATTGAEGQVEAICFAFGTSGISNDVWFDWTADADGLALINTCGSPADTRLAAWPTGGCPVDGTSLACNDDSCGLQSSIAFEVTSGSSYLLQAGNFPGASASGANVLNVSIIELPEGYAYDLGTSEDALGLTAGGGLGWLHGFEAEGGSDQISEVSSAYGTPFFPGTGPGLAGTVAIWDDPTNDFDPTDAVLLYSAPIVTANEDTDIFNAYSIPNVRVSGVFFIGVVVNQPVGDFVAPMDFDVPSAGRAWVVGNTSGSGGFGAFDYGNLAANDVPPLEMGAIGFPAVFLLRAVGAEGLGTSYCTAAPNSVSADGSRMSASGSTSLGAMDLALNADNAPPSQRGLFIIGSEQASVPFGNGFRCVQGLLTRSPLVIESGGEFGYAVDFNVYGALLALLGTANFQCWYRDPAAGGEFFNLSDGLEIIFEP